MQFPLILGSPFGIGGFTAPIDQTGGYGPLFVGLDEVKRHLRIQFSTDDTELSWLTVAATAACETYLRRPLAQRSVTQSFDGGGTVDPLYLNGGQVIAVESVTIGGIAQPTAGYTVNLQLGVVYLGTYDAPLTWTAGYQNVVITYLVGMVNPPADIRLAVLREVEHLYQRTQNAPHPALGQDGFDEMMRDTQTAMPWPVRYLLDNHRHAGGFA